MGWWLGIFAWLWSVLAHDMLRRAYDETILFYPAGRRTVHCLWTPYADVRHLPSCSEPRYVCKIHAELILPTHSFSSQARQWQKGCQPVSAAVLAAVMLPGIGTGLQAMSSCSTCPNALAVALQCCRSAVRRVPDLAPGPQTSRWQPADHRTLPPVAPLAHGCTAAAGAVAVQHQPGAWYGPSHRLTLAWQLCSGAPRRPTACRTSPAPPGAKHCPEQAAMTPPVLMFVPSKQGRCLLICLQSQGTQNVKGISARFLWTCRRFCAPA